MLQDIFNRPIIDEHTSYNTSLTKSLSNFYLACNFVKVIPDTTIYVSILSLHPLEIVWRYTRSKVDINTKEYPHPNNANIPWVRLKLLSTPSFGCCPMNKEDIASKVFPKAEI